MPIVAIFAAKAFLEKNRDELSEKLVQCMKAAANESGSRNDGTALHAQEGCLLYTSDAADDM
eukprot:667417-Karenia_brevis.AAC.1